MPSAAGGVGMAMHPNRRQNPFSLPQLMAEGRHACCHDIAELENGETRAIVWRLNFLSGASRHGKRM